MSNPSRRRPTSPEAAAAPDDDDGITRYLVMGRIVAILLVVVIGGWSALASISGAVIASGIITVESNSKSAQHPDGGIIGEILVKDGDEVQTGDVLLRFDTADLEDELSGLRMRQRASEAEYQLVGSELTGLRDLKEQGLVTNERLMTLERQAARLMGERGQLSTDQARLAAKVKRAEVRAPISGYVHSLAFHTVGGVVAPGQEMLTIVPSRDRLIVEVRLDPRDIDQVRKGQEAEIRLTSFNQRDTPKLAGVVAQVSADLVRDEARDAAYFTVRITFIDGELNRLDGRDIRPGMPVDAFVKTNSRSVLSYLVKPLVDQGTRAFREE